jgi:hypothetical protein
MVLHRTEEVCLKRLLQKKKTVRTFLRCAEPLAKLDSRWPRQHFQINVRIGQFIG